MRSNTASLVLPTGVESMLYLTLIAIGYIDRRLIGDLSHIRLKKLSIRLLLRADCHLFASVGLVFPSRINVVKLHENCAFRQDLMKNDDSSTNLC